MTEIRTRLKRGCYYLSLLLIIIFLGAGITGCGSSKDSVEQFVSDTALRDEMAVPSGSKNGMELDVAYIKEFSPQTAAASEVERKVIQNANMTVEVKDVAASLEMVIKVCEENGGYVVTSNISRDEEWTRAEASIKVPYMKLTKVMGEIEDLGDMTSKNISAEDVTQEYYDSQARLTVLKKKEERLLVLMDEAKTIEEIISVENELSQVQGDIEVLEGRVKYLNNMTSYSSIYVTLRKAVPGSLEVPQGTLGKAGQAFINSINAVVDFLSSFVIGLMSFIPWAVLFALLYLVLRFLKKKNNWSFHRKRKKDFVNSLPPEENKKE